MVDGKVAQLSVCVMEKKAEELEDKLECFGKSWDSMFAWHRWRTVDRVILLWSLAHSQLSPKRIGAAFPFQYWAYQCVLHNLAEKESQIHSPNTNTIKTSQWSMGRQNLSHCSPFAKGELTTVYEKLSSKRDFALILEKSTFRLFRLYVISWLPICLWTTTLMSCIALGDSASSLMVGT